MKTIKFKENHEVRKGIIFLIFALLCSLNLSAQTEFVIGNLKYTMTSSSTVSVSKNEIITGKLVIPETVKYNGTQYSVTSIGNWAFWGCTGLTSVTIPNSVTSIEGSAFRDCNSLTSVTIGNSVTSIEGSAFGGCTGLTSVTIPNSVTSIGSSAFWGCTGLTSVTIPNSVTSIGIQAFYDCTGLTEINVDENNTAYSSIDGVLFNKSQTELVCYPYGKQGAYVIPNSVTSIGDYAFYKCSSLTSVTIPNSVTSIGEAAFYRCI